MKTDLNLPFNDLSKRIFEINKGKIFEAFGKVSKVRKARMTVLAFIEFRDESDLGYEFPSSLRKVLKENLIILLKALKANEIPKDETYKTVKLIFNEGKEIYNSSTILRLKQFK